MKRAEFRVAPEEAGMTLLSFLRRKCGALSSVKGLKRLVEGKRCTIQGRVETFSTHPLTAGNLVRVEIASTSPKPEKPQLLWQDEVLAAYDKPAGVVCTPANFPHPLVHRLDKETSGVVLVAKSHSTLEQMIELFREKEIQKTYLAIVNGAVKKEAGVFISRLGPKHRFQGHTLYGSTPNGKYAETRWERVGGSSLVSLVKCHPMTGRTHQLRVQWQEAGFPILGDDLYARQFHVNNYHPERHLLHAHEMAFIHPISHEPVTLRAPVPEEFFTALRALGMAHLCELFRSKEQ